MGIMVMRGSLGISVGGIESVQYIRSTPMFQSWVHAVPVNNPWVTIMVMRFTPSALSFLQQAISVCPVSIMSSTMTASVVTEPLGWERVTPALVWRFLNEILLVSISATRLTASQRSIAPSSGATRVAPVNDRPMIICANVSESERELIGSGIYSRSSSL